MKKLFFFANFGFDSYQIVFLFHMYIGIWVFILLGGGGGLGGSSPKTILKYEVL